MFEQLTQQLSRTVDVDEAVAIAEELARRFPNLAFDSIARKMARSRPTRDGNLELALRINGEAQPIEPFCPATSMYHRLLPVLLSIPANAPNRMEELMALALVNEDQHFGWLISSFKDHCERMDESIECTPYPSLIDDEPFSLTYSWFELVTQMSGSFVSSWEIANLPTFDIYEQFVRAMIEVTGAMDDTERQRAFSEWTWPQSGLFNLEPERPSEEIAQVVERLKMLLDDVEKLTAGT